MLKYCLRENLLTAKPDDFMAQVTDSQVFTLDDIIERMVKRGTTVTRTDLAALMQLYTQECTYIVEEGGTLNTPLINTSYSISGVFDGADDGFDAKRHALHLNITAGTGGIKSDVVSDFMQRVCRRQTRGIYGCSGIHAGTMKGRREYSGIR
ncbi:DNA-binding domain-containing protein [Treponema sp. OMZ 840]|uniref:DNA-binding domain-containing protein n=1 Tax=Treponema sp. OMZ 840 TaxID=244313 RepID=UPI003D944D2D